MGSCPGLGGAQKGRTADRYSIEGFAFLVPSLTLGSARSTTRNVKREAYSWQQAAGPPRIPQVPAAAALHPAGALDRAPPTENTEICCVSFLPWQVGHSGWRDPITSASNGFLQSWQMYSNMGMSVLNSEL